MTKRNVLIAAGVATLLVLFIARCRHDKKQDTQILSPVLSPNTQEKIIVNSRKHEIVVITPRGTETTSLPPGRPVAITEDSHGKLTVQVRTWGTEFAPFAGVGFSDSFRPCLGVSVFYWHRLDLNLGVTTSVNRPLVGRALLTGSVNLFSNTYFQAGIESNKSPYVGLFVRF